jgi:hypothetical protein
MDYPRVEIDNCYQVDEDKHVSNSKLAELKPGDRIIVKFVYYMDVERKPVIHLKDADFRNRIFRVRELPYYIRYGTLIGLPMVVKDIGRTSLSAYFDDFRELDSIFYENVYSLEDEFSQQVNYYNDNYTG